MRRKSLCVLAVAVVFAMGALSVSAEPIKIGAIISYTGPASVTGPGDENTIKLLLDETGWEVAGRKIEVIKVDEGSGDPTETIAGAKKLVEGDRVDVVLGPVLMHTAAAVASYCSSVGVPHVVFSSNTMDIMKNETVFLPQGTGRGQTYVCGQYAYDKLGYRTASMLIADYAGGHEFCGGFIDGFESRGGKIIQKQLVPMMEANIAPYIGRIKEADCVAWWLVGPSSIAFPKQYRQYGFKMPLVYSTALPLEEPQLAQIGDHGLGMISSALYSPEIDTEINRDFVSKYKDSFGEYPGMAAMECYVAMKLFLEAVKATGGDTGREKIKEALKGVKNLVTPAGTLSMTQERMGIQDQYILELSKKDNRYFWKVLAKYSEVRPR
jgi:branched-chain amino acid transport system substrate-binding protein